MMQLVMLMVLLGAPSALWAAPLRSAEETKAWLQSLERQFRPEEMAEELGALTGQRAPIEGQSAKPLLKIFVSSSMPEEALKGLLKEAEHFGGVLVLKGLPENSWKALAQLVLAIAEDDTDMPMQIDEEEFNRFGIDSVPAFVLIEPQEMKEQLAEKLPKFDQISGNLTIRLALEYMSKEGDLGELAQEYLAGKYAK